MSAHTTLPDAPEHGRDGAGEEGRASILIIGFLVVVLGFLLVAASITSVHVQNRRLMTCADRVAAAASGAVSEELLFLESLVSPTPQLAPKRGELVAQRLADTTCRVGHGASVVSVTVSEDQVLVQMQAQATVPLVPAFLGSVVEPTLTATSSARTH